MPIPPTRVAVIIGSTRQGRFAPVVADWLIDQLHARDDLEADVIDLAAFPLPLSLGQLADSSAVQLDIDALTADLATRLNAADGFIVVTPEYNHSFPAALKNAIDWHRAQWQAKPVGFVSYGGMSGGLRAVEQLRLVFAELHAVTIRDSVSFHNVWQRFDPAGQPRDAEACNAALKKLLDQFTWWAGSLREARSRAPYAA